MAARGRGCLEIKSSTNPFMQTMASDIGMRAKQIEWTAPEVDLSGVKPYKSDGSFSFLYTRESDVVGSRVAKPMHSLAYEPKTKGEMLREKRDKLRVLMEKQSVPIDEADAKETASKNLDAEIASWKQGTKSEDPRYTTSNNEIGIKNPSIA